MNKPRIATLRRRNLVLATLLATAAFQGSSYADLLKIGVNFLGRDGSNPIGVDEVAGLPGYVQQDWNNLGNNVGGEPSGNFADPPINNLTSGSLFRDDGIAGSRGSTTTPVTITVNTNDSWHSDGPTGTPNERLMRGIIKAGTGSTLTLTVNGLDPLKSYDFLAYTNVNNAGSQGNLTLAGVSAYPTYYVTEDNAFDGTFTIGNSTDPAARSIESDYSIWNTVTPSAAGTLTLTIQHITGGDGFGLPAIQIRELFFIVGAAYWNVGAGTGAWNTAALNWRATDTAGSSDTAFVGGNATTFGDLGAAGARTVNVDPAGVSPGATIVNNSVANPYTIQGGPILSEGELVKDGPGALTMTGANEFFGAVTLKHGTVNVTTIGDASAAGNLGKGNLITIGDTGANDAVLNYGGVTTVVNRSVVMSGNGGAVNVTTAGADLTFTNLSGTGDLTKGGAGGLIFTGDTSNLSGNVSVTGGNLTVRRIGSGVGKNLSLNGGTSFNVSAPGTQTDARTLILNGNASVGVTDAGGNYALTGDVNSTNVLTKTGNGRLALAGNVTLTQMPVISAGTLALTKEGSIDIPNGAINIGPGQRLEVVPGALDAANPITLSGGALRAGHEGLQGYYFTGGYNQGQWLDNMNGSAFHVAGQHAAASATAGITTIPARTTTGGQTNLDWRNAADQAAPPFLNQGVTAGDDIRAIYTGKIRIDVAGDTRFYTTSDDGSAIFIDGVRVVNNNAFQGQTERTGTINLSAGLHDFLMYFYEGGGGAGIHAEYIPSGGVRQVIPNSVLLSGDVVDYTTTPVTVTAPSTIESGAALARFGALTLPANTLLTLNGSSLFTNTTLTGAAHQVAVTGFNANSNLGVLSAPSAITKTGNGNLVFAVAPPVGTTLTVNEGMVVAMGSSAGGNPLAATPLTFATNTGLGLSSTSGNVTYTNPIPTGINFTIAAGSFGNDNIVAPTTVTAAPATLVAGAGNTLTLRTNNQNFTLAVTPQITGAGNVVTEEGPIVLNGGVNNVGGNFSNRVANVTVNGNVSTSAFLQEGNFNNLGNNLVAGQIVPGGTTITGTLNATSVTNTRGTLSVAGVTANTGALTLNGNGTTTFAASTHNLANLSNNATLNANGSFTSTGALSVTGAGTNANLNAGGSASNAVLPAGNLNLKGTFNTATGINATQGANVRFNAGTGNTSTLTGGDVTLTNQSNVVVNSGTADLSAVAIHATPFITTLTNNALGARLVNIGGGRLDPRDVNLVNGIFAGNTNPPTTLSKGLTQALSFNSDVQVRDFFATTDPNVDRFTAIFYGRYTPTAASTTFGMPFHDDNAAIWVDSNRNGTFEAAEKLLDSACCPANVNATPAALTAGLSYNVLFGVEDTGGGGSIGVNITAGALNNVALNPADAAQAGFFSYFSDNNAGGNLQVDAGATLVTKSFDGVTNLRLANTSAVTLTNKGASTASSADTIRSTGANANVFLGDNNALTVGEIDIVGDGNLNINKPAGAVNGGRIVVSGTASGLPATSDIGAGSINVQGGTLIINSAVTGSGSIRASVSGTVGGTGTIPGALELSTGGIVAPGDGVGTFTVGSLLLLQGTMAVEIQNTSSYDRLVVALGGTVDLGGALTASFLGGGAGAQVNDVYYILNNLGTDPVFGTFNGVADQGTINLGGGYTARISYDANFNTSFDTGGNDVALQMLTIPEPGAAVAILSGLGMLMGFQRFRRRH